RFDFDRARFDSTSVRASYNPDEHWSLQASWGYLKSPEQLDPAVNETRYTASATYVTKLGPDSSLAATLAWGLKDLSDGHRLNGLLFETEVKPAQDWTAFARAEWEQNNEIDLTGAVRAVGEITLGGIHDWKVADRAKLGLGASFTFDFVPSSATPHNGGDPHGALVFVRFALARGTFHHLDVAADRHLAGMAAELLRQQAKLCRLRYVDPSHGVKTADA